MTWFKLYWHLFTWSQQPMRPLRSLRCVYHKGNQSGTSIDVWTLRHCPVVGPGKPQGNSGTPISAWNNSARLWDHDWKTVFPTSCLSCGVHSGTGTFYSCKCKNAVNLSNHFSFSVHPQPSVWSPFNQKNQWTHPAPEGSGKRWPSWQHQANHKDPAHNRQAHRFISAHYSPCRSHHGPEEHCKEGAQTGTSVLKRLFKISAASSPIDFITNLAFFFSFELGPGTGSPAVHGQEPWPWASYAFLHRPVWNQTFSWFGDSTCQHCEDREESAVSELHLLSHEVPEQEHLHHPLISVRILFSLQSINKSTWGCSHMWFFFCCGLQCCSLQDCSQNAEPKVEQTEPPFQQSHPSGCL